MDNILEAREEYNGEETKMLLFFDKENYILGQFSDEVGKGLFRLTTRFTDFRKQDGDYTENWQGTYDQTNRKILGFSPYDEQDDEYKEDIIGP